METWPYQSDLDFIVEDPEGTAVAFALGWYDEANRLGEFEPVGTDPRTSESRVRENRMHGSRWRREETGTSRQNRTALAPPADPTSNSEAATSTWQAARPIRPAVG